MGLKSGHTAGKQAARRKRGQLWVCAVLLLLICTVLVLARCAGKLSGQRAEGQLGSAVGGTAGGETDPPPSGTYELPEGWKAVDYGPQGLSQGSLVLVNADHGFDPSGVNAVSVWEHKTLSYYVKDVYLSLEPRVIEHLNDWMDDFAEQTGLSNVNAVAGFRSVEDQQALYDNAVRTKGQDHADRYLALPGHSEHHTGLAVDLNIYDIDSGASRDFPGGGDYAWAAEHAWEYGFVQRYPVNKSHVTGIDYESWHYRYVGRPHAFCMDRQGFCLEEYVDYLRGFPFDGEHLFVDCGDSRYEIYFCAGTTAIVPETGSFTVSGNNVDGLIVTVFLDGNDLP